MEALQEPEIPQISSGALSSSEKVQLRSKGRLSSGERLMILPNLARVFLRTFASIFGSFLHGKDDKPPSLYRYVIYSAIRAITDIQSPRQLHHVSPSTDAAYKSVCKRYNMTPNVLTLPDSTTGLWIGNPKASKILINFHGGGYVLPASKFMIDFMFRLQKLLSGEDGKDFAVICLSYDLAPEAKYPRQLQQAAILLEHITGKLGRDPSTIFLSGDSAGGNLALALLSHISHPHPDTTIPHLNLSSKLAGVILVSPWLDFRMDASAYGNKKDLIGPVTGKKWSAAWLGTPWPHTSNADNYNQAQLAPASWWEDLQIEEALIVAGQDELLMPGINEFRQRWQNDVKSLGTKKVAWLCAVGEAHDMPSLDLQLGYEKPGEQARMIRSWLSSRL